MMEVEKLIGILSIKISNVNYENKNFYKFLIGK